MARLLIVDDERQLLIVLQALLTEQGFEVAIAESGEQAVSVADRFKPDLVILDVTLPGISGLETFNQLRGQFPLLPCIFMTAYGTIRSAVDAIRAGGDDYLPKPFDNHHLLLAIRRSLELRRLNTEVEELRTVLNKQYGLHDVVGISAAMREIFRIASRVAASDATVLILGESGTGKELVARGIHRQSTRSAGAFVAVNCSAIPATLVEAEFFGHERGAFTDAKETRLGKFEQAQRGTLFLDEVGDLPIEAQAKLLRVLQDRQVTRLGGRRPIDVDVRVLAATNKDLDAAVRKGLFREDLFWRLNVLSVRLPPLRERPEDLPLLIDSLLDRLNQEQGIQVRGVTPEARRLMSLHDWPGNVRELENTLRRAAILSDTPDIRVADLPPRIRGGSNAAGADDDRARLTLGDAARRAVERVERTLIQASLDAHGGNRSEMAASLGINRKTLFNKLRGYGMVGDQDSDSDAD